MKLSDLRIALVGPLPPPSGGMANQTQQLARLLRAEGAKVELIQVNRPYRPLWVGKIKGARAIFRLLPYFIHLWRAADKIQLYHVMANSGWSWHLFAAPVIWIAKIKRKPVIVNYRGGEAGTFLDKAMFWVKPSLDRADVIIVPSGFLEVVFKERGVATSIVPNIIDLSRFSAKKEKTTSFKEGGCVHILVTRNLELIYDNATAIRAFKFVKDKMPMAQLTIAGSGPEENALKALVVELALVDAVTFSGRVDNQKMAALYQSADIMINPSLVDNMPNSVLEALACGVAVVSTNVGGVPYLVEHEKTALLVPAQDPMAMSSAILSLIADSTKMARMTHAGVESVKQYTWLKVRDRLLTIYQQVVKQNKQSGGSDK